MAVAKEVVKVESDSPFPDPWRYFGVPFEDMEDLIQLYVHVWLQRPNALAEALDTVLHAENSDIARMYREARSTNANHAGIFFIVSDFLAQKYFRFHPKLKMKPMPKEVLAYLKYPYNQMTSLDYEDQKRFRDSLPPEHRGDVYIDE